MAGPGDSAPQAEAPLLERLDEARAITLDLFLGQAPLLGAHVAQAQLDLLLAGAAPQEIAIREAEVRRAEVAVEVARASLAHTEVHAPFAGTVTAINVEVGNTANPGQIACVLAMMNQLQARTIDLTELDIGRVEEGQLARVTVDALPELEIPGHVARIEKQSADYRGDVVYPVLVELDEDVAGLRWGMTAIMNIRMKNDQ